MNHFRSIVQIESLKSRGWYSRTKFRLPKFQLFRKLKEARTSSFPPSARLPVHLSFHQFLCEYFYYGIRSADVGIQCTIHPQLPIPRHSRLIVLGFSMDGIRNGSCVWG